MSSKNPFLSPFSCSWSVFRHRNARFSSCMRRLTTRSRRSPRSLRKPRSIVASSFIARKAISRRNATASRSRPPSSASAPVSFVAACQSGNLATLTKLLASDVTAWADGGGKVRASLHPISGQERVAKLFIIALRHRVPVDNVLFLDEINGAPAILSWSDRHLNWVQTFDIRDTVIAGLYTLVYPDKLAFLQRQLESRSEPFLSSSHVLP
jgi:hypothetical protein